MPDIGSNAFPVVFGDFSSGFRIYDRVGLSILRDPFTQATSVFTRFHARRRLAPGVRLPSASENTSQDRRKTPPMSFCGLLTSSFLFFPFSRSVFFPFCLLLREISGLLRSCEACRSAFQLETTTTWRLTTGEPVEPSSRPSRVPLNKISQIDNPTTIHKSGSAGKSRKTTGERI